MRKLYISGSVIAALLVSAPAVASHNFDDVPSSHPHHTGIDWVASNNITAGCDSDSYCPGDPVTRAQMATFLHKYDQQREEPAPRSSTTVKQHVVTKIGPGFVECPASTFVVGGGFQTSGQEQHEVYASHPIARSEGFDREGWNISVNYNGSQGEPISQAICLEVTTAP